MQKYNCDNIADCVHELQRLCNSMKCNDCPMKETSCDLLGMNEDELAAAIVQLQEWSDANPEE